MKILALDLGTNCGWAYTDEIGTESGAWMAKTYSPWAKCFLEVLELYKPEMIVCSQTNNFGHFNATRKMYMLFGIVCLLSERIELPVVEYNDKSARKNLFGSGKLKKEEAHELFDKMFPDWKMYTGDQKDAIILGLGWVKMNQE